ncbi:MAG: amidophosphoribosyltransferase [Spirochaetales bacterium]|nr:amidophosphoribosyltransferase [Spirochaetales bacterium]
MLLHLPVVTFKETPLHHCGIVGIYSHKKINVPKELFYPLFSLQHRGQESCGIAYHHSRGQLITYKDLGMVGNVLSHYLTETHSSYTGIGHVRYSTRGGNKLENAQPVLAVCNKGQIALAHNGNISNSMFLKNELIREGSILQSTSDTELILHYIAKSKRNDFTESLMETLERVEGAYSFVMIHNDTLIAARDPYGFRPLVIGEKSDMMEFASETCALDILGMNYTREVNPGEIILVNKYGKQSVALHKKDRRCQCIFELIYFARPDSILFGYPVHTIRKKMGGFLAHIDNLPGDIVCAVPDSGNSAALGYSESSGVGLEYGLTRNHYSGRTFIQPAPDMRESGVRMKLHPMKAVINGKRVILIDDSLVRGTTSRIIVKLIKEAGAKEVHLRLCAPEIKYPCFFGIDIPTKEELISNRMSPADIAHYIGADSVRFLPLEYLRQCVSNPEDFCFACFNGNYPFDVKDR